MEPIACISPPDLAQSQMSRRFSAILKNYSMNNRTNVTRVQFCTIVCCKTCYDVVVLQHIHIFNRYQHQLGAGLVHNFDCDVHEPRRHQLTAYP